jgi:hypothetical protein
VLCRCDDDAWPELFDSGIYALYQAAERHQQAVGVPMGASDQFAMIGVTQPACVLRELLVIQPCSSARPPQFRRSLASRSRSPAHVGVTADASAPDTGG